MGIENEKPPEIEIVSKDASFYLLRLADLVDLKKHVDRGLYPVNHYEGVPMNQGLMDLEGGGYRDARGLRWGVNHAITGTFRMLGRLGYKNEANMVLQMLEGDKKK